MTDFLQKIIEQLHDLLSLEGVAVFFAILQVALAYYNKRWNFVAGIISTAIFIYLFGFTDIKLYADASLQLYYLIMSIYGWMQWSRSEDDYVLAISFTSSKEWIITVIISVFGTIGIFNILNYFTDSTVPFLDAVVTAIAWAGTWLMTRRKVEYWLVLNVSNLIAIPLFIFKDLYLTALLTVILFIVAIFGFIKWRKLVLQKRPD